MIDDLKFNPARVYLRPIGSEEWIDLGPVSRPEPVEGPVEGSVEVRRRIQPTKVTYLNLDGVEVDVTDDFDLEHGITLTAAFPTMEEAEAFARKWGDKEDT